MYERVKAKYPVKVGVKLMPKGALGTSVGKTGLIQDWFPGVGHDPESDQIVIKFDDAPKEIIVSVKQIEFI